jgi:AcrR family transcriptional regulator
MTQVVQNYSAAASRRGRPRSIERHHAILDATRALLSTGSYDELTMEAIAAGAGVSKPTLYKWWPSRAAIVTEAVIAGYLGKPTAAPEDTGNIAVDLGTWLHARLLEQAADPAARALIRAMTAATAEGEDSDRNFRLLAEPARQALLQRLEAAAARGQIRADADLEAAVDVVISILLLHALTPLPRNARARTNGLLGLLLHGLLHKGAPRRRSREVKP